MLTQELLKSILHYNPDTGIFTRIKRTHHNCSPIGSIVGTIHDEYLDIRLFRKDYRAHRLAFLYMNGALPELQVDHVNHVKTDNRWCNLRLVTNQFNQRNVPIQNNNKSGFTGVCWYKPLNKWCSQIRHNNKVIHLGYFDNKDDAISARISANKLYGYHNGHGAKH